MGSAKKMAPSLSSHRPPRRRPGSVTSGAARLLHSLATLPHALPAANYISQSPRQACPPFRMRGALLGLGEAEAGGRPLEKSSRGRRVRSEDEAAAVASSRAATSRSQVGSSGEWRPGQCDPLPGSAVGRYRHGEGMVGRGQSPPWGGGWAWLGLAWPSSSPLQAQARILHPLVSQPPPPILH